MPIAAPADSFRIIPLEEKVQVAPPFGTIHFHFRLIHLGSQVETYTCRSFGDFPVQWLSSLCSESECTYDSVDVILAPGEWQTVYIDVSPFGAAGGGTMELRIRAHEAPGEVRSTFIGAISGVTRLVVDDDLSEDSEDYVVSAFAANGITCGVWPAWITTPGPGDLSRFASVYWLTGSDSTSSLTGKEQAELTAFLDAGGRILVSGQGLGPDIGDTSFYAQRLGASYVQTGSGSTEVTGTAEDPIGDGLSFVITGGSGANNQQSPDAIEAISHPVFEYGNGLGAGARVEGGNLFRTVYLPFGLEGVAEAADRAVLIDRIRAWLEAPLQSAVDEVSQGAPVIDANAFPNPSPGPTRLVANVSGHLLSDAPGAVFFLIDAGGRSIARLSAVPIGRGRWVADWNGRTASGALAPRGAYFYRIELGDGRAAGGRAVGGRFVVIR